MSPRNIPVLPTTYEPVHETLVLFSYAYNESSDGPAHLQSRARAFAQQLTYKCKQIDEGLGQYLDI